MTPVARHKGTALILALVLLVGLTALGLASARRTVLQEQMARNIRQHQIAFEGAEMAVRQGERFLWGTMGGPRPIARPARACRAARCRVLQPGGFDALTDDWVTPPLRNGPDIRAPAAALHVSERPMFFVVERQAARTSPMTGRAGARMLQFYHVHGRGAGEEAQVESILQSTFVVLF